MNPYARPKSPRHEKNQAYYLANREEILRKQKAWREANPEHVRAYRQRHKITHADQLADSKLRHSKGIGLVEYNALFEAQGGVCAICRRPEKRLANNGALRRHLAVDHDHDTARIRGLLCSTCNAGLGHFDEDPALLIAAAAYLAQQPLEEVA